jgi:hypothetical protein
LKTRPKFSTADVEAFAINTDGSGQASFVFKIDNEPFVTELFIKPTTAPLTPPPFFILRVGASGDAKSFELDEHGKPWTHQRNAPLVPGPQKEAQIADAISAAARKKQ